MKRLLGLLLLCATPLWATTYYVDGACGTAGNGTGIKCLASPDSTVNNPKLTLTSGLALLTTAGDILNVRGIHAAHDACLGSTEGRYAEDGGLVGTFNNAAMKILSKTGAAGNPIIVQANGYTVLGAATQETVYVENTLGATWTQCADCSATGPTGCRNMPGICSHVWTTSGVGAVRGDGVPCHRESSAANVDLQYDCFYDSPSIAVRWISTPTSEERIIRDNGSAIAVLNSSYVTVRGFTARNTEDTIVAINAISGPDSNIVIQDNKIMYASGNLSGGDYGVHITGVSGAVSDITVDHNEIAHTGSEGIHTQPKTAGAATVYTITHNYIHDIGSPTILGPGVHGTPSGMIIGNNGGGSVGNYTGSVIQGNLIRDITQYTNGCCISLENDVDSLVIRDNICKDPGGPCWKISCTNVSCDGIQMFNNLCTDPNQNAAGLGGLEITGLISNLSIFNNVFKDHVKAYNTDMISFYGATGGSTGNIVRNNILWSDRNGRQLNWQNNVDGGVDSVQNNLIYPSGTNPSQLLRLRVSGVDTDYNCAAVAAGCGGNCASSLCSDPQFTSLVTPDFHIQTTSPAKDAGTATGMPAARTTDINNLIASNNGFPFYNDATPIQGGTWDMGIDEFISGGGGGTVVLDVTATDAPDPVAAGALLTYTLTYHNTGSASGSNVTIVDQLPSNVTYVSCSGGVSCVNLGGGSNVYWSLGTVVASGSGTVTLTVRVNSVGGGTIIRNDTYAIFSDETGTIFGPADTTTVSSSNSRRGRIFPHGMR